MRSLISIQQKNKNRKLENTIQTSLRKSKIQTSSKITACIPENFFKKSKLTLDLIDLVHTVHSQSYTNKRHAIQLEIIHTRHSTIADKSTNFSTIDDPKNRLKNMFTNPNHYTQTKYPMDPKSERVR